MATTKQHLIVAGSLGLIGYSFYCESTGRAFSFAEAAASVGIAALGGIAPDLFEPALHPNHRGVCHGVLAGGVLARSSLASWNDGSLPQWFRVIAALFAVGYISHLTLDACTPKGLPLVC